MVVKSSLVWLLVCASACESEKPAAPQKDPWASSDPAPTASNDPAPTASTSGGSKKWYEGDAPVGVWLGIEERLAPTTTFDGTTYLSDAFRLTTFVVWPDGHLSHDVPWAGLADFDRGAWERGVATDASLGGTPGTYTRAGDGWRVTYVGGFETTMKYAGDELRIQKAKLKRAVDVTGATLDGTYTYFSDPEDPVLAGPGCRRFVTFTRDGKFDNRGGLARTCPAAADDPGAPGTGTYEIRDFSLVLHYADGRVVKQLVMAPQNGDLRVDNSRAVIMGQVWTRRSSPIADVAQAGAAATTPPPPVATNGETTYDAITFGTPPGTAQQTKTSLSFTATAGDAFCMTAVFAGVPSTGTPDRDFAAEWKDVMLNGRTADEAPAPRQGRTPSGLVFDAAGTTTTEAGNGARVYRALFVFEVGGRRVSVMFVAPTEAQLTSCKPEAFIATVRGA